MVEKNKALLISILEDLKSQENPSINEMISVSKALLTNLLVLKFQEERSKLFEEITQKVDHEISGLKQEETKETSFSGDANSMAKSINSDEIKVLPHPEGPPPHRPIETEPELIAPVINEMREVTSTKAALPALNIGLNDRVAFVNKLFNGSMEDYSRVISQINTMDSFEEVIGFIEGMIKPEFNWEDKEDFEMRFLELLKARYGVVD